MHQVFRDFKGLKSLIEVLLGDTLDLKLVAEELGSVQQLVRM